MNLYVGEHLPTKMGRWAELGSIRVELAGDYEYLVQQMPRRSYVRVECSSGKRQQFEERIGDWVATAVVEVASKGECSLLSEEPDQDGGIWDIEALLTFISGRKVVREEEKTGFLHKEYGEPACSPVETLQALRVAWGNRSHLRDSRLFLALHCYNEALHSRSMLVQAGLISTALNIILDSFDFPSNSVDKQIRKNLAKEVENVVDKCSELSNEHAQAYKNILRGKVLEGVGGSQLSKLIAFLQSIEVVSDPILDSENGRAKILNSIRNGFVHSARVSDFRGLDKEKSSRYLAPVIGGVVPELVRLFLGRKLGFVENGIGSLSQHKESLRQFFRDGVYNEWKLEEKSWEEFWFGLDANNQSA